MARASATSDVFSALADSHRREILDTLMMGEMPVGAIVSELDISQPRVSKHLRILSDVGLVECRAVGRRRLYRLSPRCLRPLSDWVGKYEVMWSRRLDQLDDHLVGLQSRTSTKA